LMNEALVLLEEGVDIKQIDDSMMDLGFPVGPVTLLDEVGIDVGVHVSKIMAPLFARRGAASGAVESFEKLFDAGYRGKKNNKGFYRYETPARKKRKKKKIVNTDIYDFFGGKERQKIDNKDIQDRLFLIMINEAAHCLQDGILGSPRDGDIGAVFGLGFPPFLGGPFRYMDSHGVSQILSSLELLEKKHGSRYTPAQIIRDKATRSECFYTEE
jgi:3-hydroxyacyl-CoA dehydrogenase/enoyl-CoA hydratase/3-hydroxybutyryl-CoA epimerase